MTVAARQLAAGELIAPDLAAPELAAPELAAPELAAPELAAPELAAPHLVGGKPGISSELIERAAPVSLATEQWLPVLDALETLLPARGLRRGSVVTVQGSSSLALALAAAASAEGSWCAAVGRPALGLVAAAELGIVLHRFPLVPAPDPSGGAGPGGWAWVVATLLDAVDLVIAWPPGAGSAGVRPADARRLVARARERGSVLVVALEAGAGAGAGAGRRTGARDWPEAPDIHLAVARSEWNRLGGGGGPEAVSGVGAGRLRGRRVDVVAGGRGAAARERRATLWLPAPGGGVTGGGVADGGVAVASDGEPVVDERGWVQAV